MPYYRKRVRRYSRRSRIPPVGSIVNARTGRYTRPYRGRSRRVKLGLRHVGPSVNYGQIYRVVYAVESVTAISTANSESTAAQSLLLGVDLLAAVWSSPSFAAAISNRFGAIRVKGFCINREIFNCGVSPLPSGGGFVNFVYRIDKDCAYGAAVGQTVSAMRAQQDVRAKMLGVGDGIPSRPCRFEIKVFPTARQTYILDTSIAPGAPGNDDYWDANFIMGLELGYPADSPVTVLYRDTIELLYDGLEQKL